MTFQQEQQIRIASPQQETSTPRTAASSSSLLKLFPQGTTNDDSPYNAADEISPLSDMDGNLVPRDWEMDDTFHDANILMPGILFDATNDDDDDNINNNYNPLWLDVLMFVTGTIKAAIVGFALFCDQKLFEASDFICSVLDRIYISIITLCTTLPRTLLESLLGEEVTERLLDTVEYLEFLARGHWLVRSIFMNDDEFHDEMDAGKYIDHADFIDHVRYERVALDG